jgi:hypothetical protein
MSVFWGSLPSMLTTMWTMLLNPVKEMLFVKMAALVLQAHVHVNVQKAGKATIVKAT